jgi:hypothetical protein
VGVTIVLERATVVVISAEILEAELRMLKRGAGLGAADLLDNAGPALCRLCGVDESQRVEMLRSRLTQLIKRHADSLPDQQRDAVLAAFALHPDASGRFLKERLEWVRSQIGRDVNRTADRLVNRGIARIAQSMQAQWTARRANPLAPTTWYTAKLDVTIRLDLAQPEFRERRTVVARESLRELELVSMVPKIGDPDLASVKLEVVSGGTLGAWSRIAPTTYSGILELPAELASGDRHEYELVYRTSPPELVRPYYLVTPVMQCDHVVIRVRFAGSGADLTVWKLDGVYRGVAEDPLASHVPTVPVRDGWAEAGFGDLVAGLTYGLRWDFR